MDHDEIHEAVDFVDARKAVASAADECAEACLNALRSIDGRASALPSIVGVASLTAERVRANEPDKLDELSSVLSLCSRVIDSAADELERLSDLPAGRLAAAAARRCAEVCRRALVLFYDTS